MIQVTILEWRNEAGDIKLQDKVKKIYYLKGTLLLCTPADSIPPEYWWGQLECKEGELGPWILETSDRKKGKLRKQGK